MSSWPNLSLTLVFPCFISNVNKSVLFKVFGSISVSRLQLSHLP